MIGNCRMGRGSPIVNCRGCQRVKGEEGGGGGLVCVRLYLVEVCAWSHVRSGMLGGGGFCSHTNYHPQPGKT